MGDQKRGDDAADHAPRPDHEERAKPPGPGGQPQDAPNYDKTTDGGRALDEEDVSSANDE